LVVGLLRCSMLSNRAEKNCADLFPLRPAFV
jgi:hypothetical protein